MNCDYRCTFDENNYIQWDWKAWKVKENGKRRQRLRSRGRLSKLWRKSLTTWNRWNKVRDTALSAKFSRKWPIITSLGHAFITSKCRHQSWKLSDKRQRRSTLKLLYQLYSDKMHLISQKRLVKRLAQHYWGLDCCCEGN